MGSNKHFQLDALDEDLIKLLPELGIHHSPLLFQEEQEAGQGRVEMWMRAKEFLPPAVLVPSIADDR